MFISQLELTSFRNYPALKLGLTPGFLLFSGANARGKSNLLEAVQLLASARSVRASADSQMIGWASVETDAQPFTRLQAEVQRRSGTVHLETLVVGHGDVTGAGRAGKRFRVNGIARRASDFIGQLRSVLFTADDLEIVSGSPSLRRQYLDSALSQRDRAYYTALARFGRILQQRNASLRRIKEGLAGQDELLLWDESMLREAAVIVSARLAAMTRLSQLASEAQAQISGARETLSVSYRPQLGEEWRQLLTPDMAETAVRQLLTAALTSQRRRDVAAGVSLTGPHRDDISVLLDGKEAADFASRAQIRTIALALRLAEARLLQEDNNDPPVLLLDDIVSELDDSRRRTVLSGLAGFDQVWFTATTASWLPESFLASCQRYLVSGGDVSAV